MSPARHTLGIPLRGRRMSQLFRTHRLPLAPHGAPSPALEAAEALPSRRGFLAGLAASMALAGMSGCSKRPKETIVPYVSQPEQMVPGEPLFFATTLTMNGYGRGSIVTSREGRPIKIEGNPDHPASLGAADAFMQAAVLDLYDPARSRTPTRGGNPATWGAFVTALRDHLATHGGDGLRLLTGNVGSPTVLRLINQVIKQFPAAAWHAYEPIDRLYTRAGASLAFGRPLEPIYHLDLCDVVLAVDSDFLIEDAGSLAYARQFAAARRPTALRPEMSRLYAVESSFSLTGSKADHRLALRPGEIQTFVFALAGKLGVGPATAFADDTWLTAVADDLKQAAGRSVVIVGDRQLPEVHAAAHRINAVLGNIGKTVELIEPVAKGLGTGAKSLADLTNDIDAGKVKTLLIFGGNPARTATADVPFAAELARLSTLTDATGQLTAFTAHLGTYNDETAFACQWHLAAQHELESWSDARAFDGTASLVQPLIAPLYDGKSAADLLNAVLGQDATSDYESVRATWQKPFANDFGKQWAAALQRGTIDGTRSPAVHVQVSPATATLPITSATSSADTSLVDVVFRPDAAVWDGRFFHNAWLHELPRPLTKICWGNAALVSPATAKRFALADGDVVSLTSGARSIDIPALMLPGLPDGVVTLHLGYGRHEITSQPVNPSGEPGGDMFGVDVYPIRTSPFTLAAVKLGKTGRNEKNVRTHNHHAMASQKGDDLTVQAMLTPVVIATPETPDADLKLHNRKIVRTATREQFAAKPDFAQAMEEKKTLSLYTPWDYSSSPQWGMTIDMASCTGCNACVIACQAENNIPVVGPEGVDREREMHWIRIDSYFGDRGDAKSPAVYHQPVPCMHCENAPCEYVCPVAATSHSTDGLNQMTYNRCVGTRYCSNNCPYKVRRFNFFNYTVDAPATVALQHNPDVTVRTLGVMEKCTYCVQRIEYAKRKSEIASLPVRLENGEDAANEVVRQMIDRLQTACQQSCPSQAITFGNIADGSTAISVAKKNPRNYGLLTELTTKPRTTYLAHISNPNPAMAGGGA